MEPAPLPPSMLYIPREVPGARTDPVADPKARSSRETTPAKAPETPDNDWADWPSDGWDQYSEEDWAVRNQKKEEKKGMEEREDRARRISEPHDREKREEAERNDEPQPPPLVDPIREPIPVAPTPEPTAPKVQAKVHDRPCSIAAPSPVSAPLNLAEISPPKSSAPNLAPAKSTHRASPVSPAKSSPPPPRPIGTRYRWWIGQSRRPQSTSNFGSRWHTAKYRRPLGATRNRKSHGVSAQCLPFPGVWGDVMCECAPFVITEIRRGVCF